MLNISYYYLIFNDPYRCTVLVNKDTDYVETQPHHHANCDGEDKNISNIVKNIASVLLFTLLSRSQQSLSCSLLSSILFKDTGHLW